MKKNVKFLFVATVIFGWCTQVHAWSGQTHSALTEKAISDSNQTVLDEYLKSQLGIDQGLNCILLLDELITPDPDRVLPEVPTNSSVLDLLKAGSRLEGIPNPRAKHHFHDPYRNMGLENKTEHPNWAVAFKTTTYVWYWGDNLFDLTGASNLKRASGTEAGEWENEYQNYFAWPDARDYFYKALTEESDATREHYLALTFLTLGHVLHFIEDVGVPARVRNDFIEAHFRGLYPGGIGNKLEGWTKEQIEDNNNTIPSDWLSGWTPQAKVFSKLSDYWDVNDYIGQYVGTSPSFDWGLSEQTNYQFLSKSTIFREDVNNTKYYFPHPDPCNVAEHVDSSWWYKRRYVSGYDITHLARTKFIQKYAYMAGMPYPTETVAYHTTFDEAVYEDYAEVTIRRTIDYATGLANYFFRGQLSVEPNWADPNIAVLTITNDSNNSGVPQVLKGGVFELYWDDADGNRAEVGDFVAAGWGPGSILDYNDTVTATFAKQAGAASYTLVYKGDICENPSDVDADDPNAVAVAVFRPGYPIIAWGRDDYGQVSDVPDGNEFIAVAAGKRHCLALKSDGSLVGWGYNNHGECNVPDGTDFTAIAAGT